MDLITPQFGLIFWQLIAFLVLLFVLSKYAWKPIMEGLKEREDSIELALKSAQEAKTEMANISANNEKLLDQARLEKDEMLKKASQVAKDLVEEARGTASKEANKMLDNARAVIQSEKNSAIADIKKQVSLLSIEIAEKVLKRELADKPAQQLLVENLIKDAKFN